MNETIKTLSIGDIHGLSVWKKALLGECYDMDNFDKIIFVGDYVDSFHISPVEQLANLNSIIEFKKAFPEKIILLLGNHDVQYMHFPKYRCSGFQAAIYPELHRIFNDNKNLFQLSYQIDNTIWTHAGIHRGWYNRYIKNIVENNPELTLSDILNDLYNKEDNCIFTVGIERGGMDRISGPLWIDRSLLWKKPISNYTQIVGHTRITDGRGIKINTISNKNAEVVFIDLLEDQYPIFYTKEFNNND